ncbi:MAG: hypothetical protein R2710_29185 [Acidimicrobiales bacterium]
MDSCPLEPHEVDWTKVEPAIADDMKRRAAEIERRAEAEAALQRTTEGERQPRPTT